MILQIQNLNKSFGGIKASSDINLQVKKGEIHAIVGPNGAGKTTLIAQISGMLKPDSGSILFNGKNITSSSTYQRAHLGLARSFQLTSVILPMTVLENVMLAVQSLSGHSFRFWSPVSNEQHTRQQALQHLEDVGLTNNAEALAGEIAHGEQRQLEIAMALALSPKLLLLDEPTAGMSKDESGKMIKLLAGIKGETTILLIEHDMDAVFSLADTTSVLVDGHIIASDTTEQIRRNPEVQRAYLGDSQV
jgi:branched-chain amino acid transport system ATP-binding protein